MKALAALLLAVALAGGCASYDGRGLPAGQATAADVHAAMGEPAEKRPGPGGETWLYYPRQPHGRAVFVARIGPDGRLIEVEQRLTPENIARLAPGATRRDEVRDLLGPPWRALVFERMQREVWTWHIRRFGAVGAPMSLHVQMSPDGVVREVYVMDDEPAPALPRVIFGGGLLR